MASSVAVETDCCIKDEGVAEVKDKQGESAKSRGEIDSPSCVVELVSDQTHL